jgi:MarR family transcriptional regulator, 2-MHQ and catechol-resistance regulon repressor
MEPMSTTTSANRALSLCPTVADDERLVLMGLLTEVDGRLRRVVGAALEEACGLSMLSFEVLIRLVRAPEGRLTMSEVADQTVHTSGGTTRLVDRMEAAGLVRRVACPNDRRTTYVEMTELGTTTLEAALAAHLEILEEHLTSQLSQEERSVLITALTKLNGGPAACAG